jgi:uncharacterized spore protein YtfJ
MMGMPTMTNPLEVIRSSVASTAEKVFVSPIERDGLTVIPAATVGAGGGSGNQGGEPGSGERGGFGLRAKPAGAFVIRNGSVRWQPAVDVNRLVMGGQVVAIVALLVLRTIVRSRARWAQRYGRRGR